MHKWNLKHCCLLLSVLVLCAVLLSAFTICSSADFASDNSVYVRNASLMPNHITVQNEDLRYDFVFDKNLYYESGSDGMLYGETLNYNIDHEDAYNGYWYQLDIEEIITNNEDDSFYMRYDRDEPNLGFLYDGENGVLYRNILRIELEEFEGDITSDLYIKLYCSTNWNEYITIVNPSSNAVFIFGCMDFDEMYTMPFSLPCQTYSSPRKEVSVVRRINADGITGTDLSISYRFFGLGLYDSDLVGSAITITDDLALYRNDRWISNATVTLGHNQGVQNTNVPERSWTLKQVSEAYFGGEQEGEEGIVYYDYYQTYTDGVTLGGQYVSNSAYPTIDALMGASTDYYSTFSYMGLECEYSFLTTKIEDYFLSEFTEITFENVPYGEPWDASYIFKENLPWGWLDLSLEGFNLTSFLDNITSFLFIDLFGFFSIADIIAIVIGISLLFAFLKLYLGG